LHTATHCNTLEKASAREIWFAAFLAHCNALQHTAEGEHERDLGCGISCGAKLGGEALARKLSAAALV